MFGNPATVIGLRAEYCCVSQWGIGVTFNSAAWLKTAFKLLIPFQIHVAWKGEKTF